MVRNDGAYSSDTKMFGGSADGSERVPDAASTYKTLLWSSWFHSTDACNRSESVCWLPLYWFAPVLSPLTTFRVRHMGARKSGRTWRYVNRQWLPPLDTASSSGFVSIELSNRPRLVWCLRRTWSTFTWYANCGVSSLVPSECESLLAVIGTSR